MQNKKVVGMIGVAVLVLGFFLAKTDSFSNMTAAIFNWNPSVSISQVVNLATVMPGKNQLMATFKVAPSFSSVDRILLNQIPVRIRFTNPIPGTPIANFKLRYHVCGGDVGTYGFAYGYHAGGCGDYIYTPASLMFDPGLRMYNLVFKGGISIPKNATNVELALTADVFNTTPASQISTSLESVSASSETCTRTKYGYYIPAKRIYGYGYHTNCKTGAVSVSSGATISRPFYGYPVRKVTTPSTPYISSIFPTSGPVYKAVDVFGYNLNIVDNREVIIENSAGQKGAIQALISPASSGVGQQKFTIVIPKNAMSIVGQSGLEPVPVFPVVPGVYSLSVLTSNKVQFEVK